MLRDLETELLLEGIFRHYGFDFRQYAAPSMKRRIWKCVVEEGLDTVSALQARILHDERCMERLLLNFSVSVTSMFRDPGFYRVFREKVVPMLRTYPFVRLWIAGCASGQELYSLAILLKEEGLYERCRLYATDMSEVALARAEAAIYPLSAMKEYTANYQKAGGTRSFSEYYTASYDNALLSPTLRQNVVFSQHNLAMDGSFNEFNVILCRNVLIYFTKELQTRVHTLLADSLCHLGFLALGSKESLLSSTVEHLYESVDEPTRVFRKRLT